MDVFDVLNEQFYITMLYPIIIILSTLVLSLPRYKIIDSLNELAHIFLLKVHGILRVDALIRHETKALNDRSSDDKEVITGHYQNVLIRASHSIKETISSPIQRCIQSNFSHEFLKEVIEYHECQRHCKTKSFSIMTDNQINLTKFLLKLIQSNDLQDNISFQLGTNQSQKERKNILESSGKIVEILVFMFFLLSSHPEYERKCFEEVKISTTNKHTREISSTDFAHCYVLLLTALRIYNTIDSNIYHLGEVKNPCTIDAYFLFYSQTCQIFESIDLAVASCFPSVGSITSTLASTRLLNGVAMNTFRLDNNLYSFSGCACRDSDDEILLSITLFTFVSFLPYLIVNEVDAKLNSSLDSFIGRAIIIQRRHT